MAFIDDARRILGPDQVLTGADMAGYSKDWTGKYVSTPLCVLRPGTTEEVASLLAAANESGTPIVPVGGNTGVSGGTKCDGGALLSLERMRRIRDIRVEAQVAEVEAGVVVETLRNAVAEHGLLFPVSFGAQGTAQIGGILSTNAGGSNVLRYGNTRAQVLGLEVVLADGRVMDLMTALHKDNSGYDLRDLMIGAEGTLGIITAAMVRLTQAPRTLSTAVIAPVSLDAALIALNRLQAATEGAVEAFEYMPKSYIDAVLTMKPDLRRPFEDEHEVNVLIDVAGAPELAETMETVLCELFEEGLILDATIAASDAQRQAHWAIREAAAEVSFARLPAVVTDIALPLDGLQAFFDAARAAIARIDPDATDLCVAHLGDGNIHYVAFPAEADPVKEDAILTAIEDVVSSLGGSFSAEHGVGLSKKPSMARQKNPVALDVMRAIKAALDPNGILNPGKVIPS